MRSTSNHPLILIIFCVIGILSLHLCNFLYEKGVSYLITFPTVAVCLMLLYFVLLSKLNKYDWFKEETDSIYKKYKGVYNSYRHHVLKNNQLYNIFVSDYCSSNIILSVQTNKEGNISIEDYNFKNKIYHRIKGLLENRYDLIEKYFHQDHFSYQDYLKLINEYDTTNLELQDSSSNDKTFEEKRKMACDEILAYYSYKNNKQIGDRIFGYLLKAEVIPAYTPEERVKAWHEFIGEEKLSDPRLHANPKLGRGKDNLTLIENLETIANFFAEINLYKAEEKVRFDLEKLSQ